MQISTRKFLNRNPLYYRNDSLVIAWNRGVFNTEEAPLYSKEGASNPSEEAPGSLRHAFALHGM